MPLTLVLIRHAKSSWSDLSQSDHARGLNDRGRRAAPLIGRWIREQNAVPAHILSSDAVRTRQTTELLQTEWPDAPNTTFDRRLYLAGPDIMLAAIQAQTAPVVGIVGHNPGMAELASMLCHTPPAHGRFRDYPTCAATILTFDVDSWADVRPHGGMVKAFAIPRELE